MVVGASAIVIDPVSTKARMAMALGARAAIDPTAGDAIKQIKELTGGRGADYAIEASGTVRAFEDAVACSAPGGVIVAVGLPRASARAEISRCCWLPAIARCVARSWLVGAAARHSALQSSCGDGVNSPIERLVSGTADSTGSTPQWMRSPPVRPCERSS